MFSLPMFAAVFAFVCVRRIAPKSRLYSDLFADQQQQQQQHNEHEPRERKKAVQILD